VTSESPHLASPEHSGPEGGSAAASEGASKPVQWLVAPTLSKPIVTWAILGLNVAVWVAMTIAGGSEDPAVLTRFGAKVDYLVVMGDWWRLLTANFLHIGLAHLLVNAYALVFLGRDAEALYGRMRFMGIYVFSGVSGTLLSFVFNPASISAGASTSLFGLLGALLAYFYRHRQVFGRRGKAYLYNILGVAAVNLLLGLSVRRIDNLGHLGGLIGGLVFGWLVVPRYRLELAAASGVARLVDTVSWRSHWRRVVAAVAALLLLVWAGIRWQSGNAEVYYAHGHQLVGEGDYVAAMADFQRAIALDPSSVEAHFALGYVLSQEGRWLEAADAFETVLALDPSAEAAHWNLGLIYARQGRLEDAVEELRRYVALGPGADEVARAEEFIRTLKAELNDGN